MKDFRDIEFNIDDEKIMNLDVDKEFLKLKKELNFSEAKTISLWPKLLKIAAVVVVFLGLAVVFMLNNDSQNTKEYASNDKVLQTTVENSTLISLNKNSFMTCTEKKGAFEVELKGEAFFEVEKNPNRKFRITTDNVVVTVKGTEFNVFEDDNISLVSVRDGKVEVSLKNDLDSKALLTKNQELIYFKKSNKFDVYTREGQNYLAWKNGKLEFKNCNLKYVFYDLSKLFRVNFEFVDKNLEEMKISSTFDNQDLSSIINVLENTLDITIEEQNQIYKVARKIQ